MHSFKLTVFSQNKSYSKEISYLILMIRPWFRECIYWMKSVIWRHLLQPSNFCMVVFSQKYLKRSICQGHCVYFTKLAAMHFLCDGVIISQEHLKRSICLEYCVYFTTLVATIHYNKLSVVNSRKFNDIFIWEKAL